MDFSNIPLSEPIALPESEYTPPVIKLPASRRPISPSHDSDDEPGPAGAHARLTDGLLESLRVQLQQQQMVPYDSKSSTEPAKVKSLDDVSPDELLRVMNRPRVQRKRAPVKQTMGDKFTSSLGPTQKNVNVSHTSRSNRNVVAARKRVGKDKENIRASTGRSSNERESDHDVKKVTSAENDNKISESEQEMKERMRKLRIESERKRRAQKKAQEEEVARIEAEKMAKRREKEQERKAQLKEWRKKQKIINQKKAEKDAQEKAAKDAQEEQKRKEREEKAAQVKAYHVKRKAGEKKKQEQIRKQKQAEEENSRRKQDEKRQDVVQFMKQRKESQARKEKAAADKRKKDEAERVAKLAKLNDFHKNVRHQSVKNLSSNVSSKTVTHHGNKKPVTGKKKKSAQTAGEAKEMHHGGATASSVEEMPRQLTQEERNNRDLQRHLTIWPADVDLLLEGPVKQAEPKRTEPKKAVKRVPTHRVKSPASTPQNSTRRKAANTSGRTASNVSSAGTGKKEERVTPKQQQQQQQPKEAWPEPVPTPLVTEEEQKEPLLVDSTHASESDIALLQLQNRLGDMVQVAQALHRQNLQIHELVENKRLQAEETVSQLQRQPPPVPVYQHSPQLLPTDATGPTSPTRMSPHRSVRAHGAAATPARRTTSEGPLSPVSYKLNELKETAGRFSQRFAKFLDESQRTQIEQEKELQRSQGALYAARADAVRSPDLHSSVISPMSPLAKRDRSPVRKSPRKHRSSTSPSTVTSSSYTDTSDTADTERQQSSTTGRGVSDSYESEAEVSVDSESGFTQELLGKLNKIDTVFEDERWAIGYQNMYDEETNPNEDSMDANDDKDLYLASIDDDEKAYGISEPPRQSRLQQEQRQSAQATTLYESMVPVQNDAAMTAEREYEAARTDAKMPVQATKAKRDPHSVINIFAKRVLEKRARLNMSEDFSDDAKYDTPMQQQREDDEVAPVVAIAETPLEQPVVDMDALMATIKAHVRTEMEATLKKHNLSSPKDDNVQSLAAAPLLENKYSLTPVTESAAVQPSITSTEPTAVRSPPVSAANDDVSANSDAVVAEPSQLDALYMAEMHQRNQTEFGDKHDDRNAQPSLEDGNAFVDEKNIVVTEDLKRDDSQAAMSSHTEKEKEKEEEEKLTPESLESALLKELQVLDKLEESRFALTQMEQSRALELVERETQKLATLVQTQQAMREQLELKRQEDDNRARLEFVQREAVKEEARRENALLEEQLREAERAAQEKARQLEEELRQTKEWNRQQELARALRNEEETKKLLAQRDADNAARDEMHRVTMAALRSTNERAIAEPQAHNAQFDAVVTQLSDMQRNMALMQTQLSASQRQARLAQSETPLAITITNLKDTNFTMPVAAQQDTVAAGLSKSGAVDVDENKSDTDMSYDDAFESYVEDKTAQSEKDDYYDSGFDTFTPATTTQTNTVPDAATTTTSVPPKMEDLSTDIEFTQSEDGIEFDAGLQIDGGGDKKDTGDEIEIDGSILAELDATQEGSHVDIDIESDIDIEISDHLDKRAASEADADISVTERVHAEEDIEISVDESPRQTGGYQSSTKRVDDDGAETSVEIEISNGSGDASISVSLSDDDREWMRRRQEEMRADTPPTTTRTADPRDQKPRGTTSVNPRDSQKAAVPTQPSAPIVQVIQSNKPAVQPVTHVEYALSQDAVIAKQFGVLQKRRKDLNTRYALQQAYLSEKQASAKPMSAHKLKFETAKIEKQYSVELSEINRKEAVLSEQVHRFELASLEEQGDLYDSRKRTHHVKKVLRAAQEGKSSGYDVRGGLDFDVNEDTAASMTEDASGYDEYDEAASQAPRYTHVEHAVAPMQMKSLAPLSSSSSHRNVLSPLSSPSKSFDNSTGGGSLDMNAEEAKLRQQEADIEQEKQYLKDLLARQNATRTPVKQQPSSSPKHKVQLVDSEDTTTTTSSGHGGSDAAVVTDEDVNDVAAREKNNNVQPHELSSAMLNLANKHTRRPRVGGGQESGDYGDDDSMTGEEDGEVTTQPSDVTSSEPSIYTTHQNSFDELPAMTTSVTELERLPSGGNEGGDELSYNPKSDDVSLEGDVISVDVDTEETSDISINIDVDDEESPSQEIRSPVPVAAAEIVEDEPELADTIKLSSPVPVDSKHITEEGDKSAVENDEKTPTRRKMTSAEKEHAADVITNSLLQSMLTDTSAAATTTTTERPTTSHGLAPAWDANFNKQELTAEQDRLTKVTEAVLQDLVADTLDDAESVFWIRKAREKDRQLEANLAQTTATLSGVPKPQQQQTQPLSIEAADDRFSLSASLEDDGESSEEPADPNGVVNLSEMIIAEFVHKISSAIDIDWAPDADNEKLEADMNKFVSTYESSAIIHTVNQGIAYQLLAATLRDVIIGFRQYSGQPIPEPWHVHRQTFGGPVRLRDQFWQKPSPGKLVETMLTKINRSLDRAEALNAQLAAIDHRNIDAVLVDKIIKLEKSDPDDEHGDEWTAAALFPYEDEVIFEISNGVMDTLLMEIVNELNDIETKKKERTKARRAARRKAKDDW